MSGGDWRMSLARLLRRRGIADQLLFYDAGPPDGGNRPRDFADLAVIMPVAEAWRQLDPVNRAYEFHVDSAHWRAWAQVVDDPNEYHNGSIDCYPTDVGEFLARCLLEWAEDQDENP